MPSGRGDDRDRRLCTHDLRRRPADVSNSVMATRPGAWSMRSWPASDRRLSGRGDPRREDVQLVERAVGVESIAVRVVRPGRMEYAAVEGRARVVAVVDVITRVVGIRRPGTDPQVWRERRAVPAERAPHLGVGVGDPVGIAGTAAAEIVARVVPDDPDLAGRRVERD